MKPCCPPGQGCNAPAGREEPCFLQRCRKSESAEADRAVGLWESFVAARRGRRSPRRRRFLRRAYARARDPRLPGAHDFLEPASASFGSRRVTWCGGALPQACGEFRGGSYQLGRRLRPAEEVGLDLPHPPAAELDVAAAVTLVAPPSSVRKRSRKCSPRSIASSSRGLRWRRSRCRDQANQPSPSRHVVATRRCVWQAGPAARAKIRIGPSNARRQASAQAPTQPS